MQKVRVVGVGMTRFGKFPDKGLRELSEEAVSNTIEDAGIDIKDVQAAYVSNSVAGLITGQETILASHRANGNSNSQSRKCLRERFDGIPSGLDVCCIWHVRLRAGAWSGKTF